MAHGLVDGYPWMARGLVDGYPWVNRGSAMARGCHDGYLEERRMTRGSSGMTQKNLMTGIRLVFFSGHVATLESRI
jgi:hypothetical protein